VNVLLIKVVLSALLALISLAVLRYRDEIQDSDRLTLSRVVGLMAASRLGLYLLVYHFAGQRPKSDVVMFFDQARVAAGGGVVYRDFQSTYGPLFDYITGLATLLWSDIRVLILLMIVFEVIAVWMTYLVFRNEMPRQTLAFAALLYAVLPAPFLLIVLSGQEDGWMWIFGALVIYLLHRGRQFMAGLAGSLGFLATKLVIVLGLGAWIFVFANPFTYLLGTLFTLVPYGIVYRYAGWQILQPLRQASECQPPSLWFLLNALLGGWIPVTSRWLSIGSLGTLGIASLYVAWKYREQLRRSALNCAALWCWVFALSVVLSPKSLATYVLFFQLPLVFVAFAKKDFRVLYANVALTCFAAFHGSYWFRIGMPRMEHGPQSVAQVAELLMEMVILASLLFIAQRSLTWIRE
jgi:hypothetical protein